MGNDFIDYLNSMNNASSGNENALAESQVMNNYYDDIKIDRQLGKQVFEELFSKENKGVILTGHAGDGKTSVLIQILNELGYFKNGKKPLQESELVDNKFFYVKDMSELKKEKQIEMVGKFLEYPKNNVASLLISNTGPLINTFKNILNEDKFERLEMDILDRLDSNSLKPIEVCVQEKEYKFIAINMSNIDNTYMVKDLFENIIKEKLWDKCVNCTIKEKCPIACNYKMCSENKDRVTEFIEKLYFWFKENESRLTMRQILAHISFAFTGNLTCEEIQNSINKKDFLFDYAFPNLLFGYSGTKFIKESINIKAIKELQKISIDKKALFADHDLFVKDDYDKFDLFIKDIIEEKINKNQTDLGITNQEASDVRRAIRRFYILLSKLNEQEHENLMEEIFSEAFNLYYKLIHTEHIKQIDRIKVKDTIFEGLYKMYVGIYSKGENSLYLTVRKNLDELQNVQLILGEVPKSELYVKTLKDKCKIKEGDNKYKISINFSRCMDNIEVTFPMLQYLTRVCNGEIFTSFNPSFTFGLNNIKAKLLRSYKYQDEDIKLMIIKKDKLEKLNIIIEEGYLQVLS